MKQVGDRVIMKAETLGKVLSGTVIYVHPSKWYYTVRFTTSTGNTFCESFQIVKEKRIPTAHEFRDSYLSQYGGPWE